MGSFSIHLPSRYRLDLKLIKGRERLSESSFIPDFRKILHAKKGNKISRFFRLIFENSKIKRAFGSNLAFLMLATSLIPQNTPLQPMQDDISVIEAPILFATQVGIQFPVEKVRITQGFRFYHQGIDIDGVTGDSVFPIMSGKVERVEYSKFGYGNSVIVNHGQETTSLYAHLSKVSVNEGDEVSKSTKIGEMGATGWAYGDHLHLEVRESGKPINPVSLLPQN